jgi:hypothetical protein
MEDFTNRCKWQPVAHNVFDDRRFTTVVKSMGVAPAAIGTVQLLVYELDGWLPV